MLKDEDVGSNRRVSTSLIRDLRGPCFRKADALPSELWRCGVTGVLNGSALAQPRPDEKLPENPTTLDGRAWSRLWSALLAVVDAQSPGRAYKHLHDKLVRCFRIRGADEPEELADLTFDRVARKLSREPLTLHHPVGYLMAVARLVWLERVKLEVLRRRRLERREAEHQIDVDDDAERRFILRCCLAELSTDNRAVLLGYYEGYREGRLASRQALTQRLGVSVTALRMRLSRLRTQVRDRAQQLLVE